MVCPPVLGDNPRADNIRTFNHFTGKVHSKATTNQIKNTAQGAKAHFGAFLENEEYRFLNLLIISYRSYYCIVTRWSDKRCLSHGMCLYQVIMTLHFLNDVVNDIESTRKSIITS